MRGEDPGEAYKSAGFKPTSNESARVCGSRLLRNPQICSRIAELQERVAEALIALEITDRDNRLAEYNERWNKLRTVINRRAATYGEQKNMGGDTGLVVMRKKKVGNEVVEEFEVDTGLLRTMAELEKQAAIEKGQWVEKQANVEFDLSKLSADQKDKLQKQLEELAFKDNPAGLEAWRKSEPKEPVQ